MNFPLLQFLQWHSSRIILKKFLGKAWSQALTRQHLHVRDGALPPPLPCENFSSQYHFVVLEHQDWKCSVSSPVFTCHHGSFTSSRHLNGTPYLWQRNESGKFVFLGEEKRGASQFSCFVSFLAGQHGDDSGTTDNRSTERFGWSSSCEVSAERSCWRCSELVC